MSCYHPIVAYKHRFRKTANGKSLIDFKGGSYREWEEITLPCGKCIGCRLEKSRQWAIRILHECEYHSCNSFITLTFAPEYLYTDSLVKQDFVKFMKDLREWLRKRGVFIRFFHCGEYGDLKERPHHHAIIFGYDFPDKKLYFVRDGFRYYRSETLERIWSKGMCIIGDVTFESAAYVARYVLKKVNGDGAEEHYHGREPEYITMSRRPGIGKQWILDHPEVYNYDEIVIRNDIKCVPPRYYDKVFAEIAPEFIEKIKEKRKVRAEINAEKNRIPGRLEQKEAYKIIQAKRLVRKFHYVNEKGD